MCPTFHCIFVLFAATTFSSGVSETARRSASRDRKANVASPSRSQTGPTEKHVRSQRSEVVQKTTKAEKQEKNEKQARDASADAVPIAITPAMLGRLTAQTWPEAYKPPDTAANDDQTKTRTDASRWVICPILQTKQLARSRKPCLRGAVGARVTRCVCIKAFESFVEDDTCLRCDLRALRFTVACSCFSPLHCQQRFA